MRLYEFDINGYRIPRAHRDDASCVECGGTNDLQQCGSLDINDPICLKCRKRYQYLPCKKGKCNVNHIKGICPESAYTEI
jgi:hypothetical protein